MQSKNFTRVIFFLFFIICFFSSKATHIVGGVMNYRYLGNDKYEISLFVYRDCINGVPPLDDPAIIKIWDGVSEEINDTLFIKHFDDTLPVVQPDQCASIDPDAVCVNWTKYLDTIILPPNDFGYTIYYQRCCRNNTIQNITYDSRGYGTMDWGATYTINIPPAVNNRHVLNSSPVFANYPPVYICVNKPLNYDNSAIDVDGDSLVYKLCTPYSGAYPYDPLNYYTSETPPFETVEWEPPYSESNMLGGVPLSIDANTGLLTGTPNTLGQFVVGVCVDEYRNGELLTHTIRDFQFNVIDCNLQIISSFFAPTVQCNNFTVNFQNQSVGATDYIWYFGDGDSSIEANPTHTYAATGVYTVTLISKNNITNTCVANYSKTISIQYKRIEADFTIATNTCLQSGDAISFIDNSTDSFNIASWHWTFSNGDTSNLPNPTLLYNGTDTSISATLLVTSINGCTSTITKTIRLFKKPPYTITPIVTKCSNVQTAQLEVNMQGNNIFSWTPTTGLSNPNIQNPTTSTNINITYYVTIKTPLSNGDTCVQLDSVQVKTINTVQINASDTTKVCNDSVRLSVPVSTGQTVIWSTSNTFTPIIGETGNISIAQTIPMQKYYVKIIAQGCEAIDSIVALYSNIIPQINLTDHILQCSNQINISANIDFSDQITWSTSNTFNPIITTSNPLITTQNIKTVKYFIKANYQTCSNTDSISITIQDTLPSIALDDSLSICGGNILLSAVVRKYTSLIWSTTPDFLNVIGNTQIISVTQNNPRQVYYLKAFYRDCFVVDSIVVNYNQNLPTISLNDSAFFCSNNVTANAITTNASNISWSLNPIFTPIISNQNTLNTIQNIAVQKYYIKVENGFCFTTDSILIRIPENATNIVLSDSIYICKDSIRINAQIQNYDSLIWSTNIDFNPIISTSNALTLEQLEPQKTYYIKVYHAGCETIDSIVVFYNDSVPEILIVENQTCSDSVIVVAYPNIYTSILWSSNSNFTDTLSTQLSFSYYQPEEFKTYYYKLNYKGCIYEGAQNVNNYSIKYNIENKAICKGDLLFIDANIISNGLPDYKFWINLNNTTLVRENTDTATILIDSSQTIYYSISNLTVDIMYGCIIQDSFKVTVNPLPIVDATVDKPNINTGEQVQLNATQNQNYIYTWQPSNLVSNDTIYNPVSSPTEQTLYTVFVNDNNNCKNQDTVSVSVNDVVCGKNDIFIPNAFSPNGDNNNDVFRVRSAPLKSYHLIIYNRWGNKIFESNDSSESWNGKYKDQLQPMDTYGYYFEGECLFGEKIILKGNITLLK